MNDVRGTMFFTTALWLEPHHFHLGLPLTLLLLCTSYNSQQAMLAIIKKKELWKILSLDLSYHKLGSEGWTFFFLISRSEGWT